MVVIVNALKYKKKGYFFEEGLGIRKRPPQKEEAWIIIDVFLVFPQVHS